MNLQVRHDLEIEKDWLGLALDDIRPLSAEITEGSSRTSPRYALLQCETSPIRGSGTAFVRYRRNGGDKRSPMPDFYIGAHAAVAGYRLLTRDVRRYRSYFPTIDIIAPPPAGDETPG